VLRCSFCGSGSVVRTPEGGYVCSTCGTVLSYEEVPGYAEIRSSYVAADPSRVSDERLELLRFARSVLGDSKVLRLMGRSASKEAVEYIAWLLDMREEPPEAAWEAYEAAVRGMSKLATDLRATLERKRLSLVEAEVRKACAAAGIEHASGEVFELACRYRNLWSGRTARVVAAAFTLVYAWSRGVKIQARRDVFTQKVVLFAKKIEPLVSGAAPGEGARGAGENPLGRPRS